MKSLLIIADPIERLSPKGDSSLLLLRQALKRNHAAYWAVGDQVSWRKDRIWVNALRCESCEVGELPRTGDRSSFALSEMSFVWIRKDPPFDSSYLKLCWLLALEEKSTPIFNKPSLLLRYHEKLVPFEAVKEGDLRLSDIHPTFICEPSDEECLSELNFGDKVVTKPFLGFAGHDVKLFDRTKVELTSSSLIQSFCEDIYVGGDKRIIVVDGEVLGSFTRLPKKGTFVSNLAQGGTPVPVELNAQEKNILDRLGVFLKRKGIFFAGVDLMGEKISEVNITSPTGLMYFFHANKRDLSEIIFDKMESR